MQPTNMICIHGKLFYGKYDKPKYRYKLKITFRFTEVGYNGGACCVMVF